jgi:hypothetical protein
LPAISGRRGAVTLPLRPHLLRKAAQKQENDMKKLLTLCFALSLFLSTAAVAQNAMKQDNNMQADSGPKAINIKGKISADGTMFVADKDGKSWKIINPDAVKGHEGHHVILNAHVYTDKGEVHVMSLKMVSDNMKNNSMQ